MPESQWARHRFNSPESRLRARMLSQLHTSTTSILGRNKCSQWDHGKCGLQRDSSIFLAKCDKFPDQRWTCFYQEWNLQPILNCCRSALQDCSRARTSVALDPLLLTGRRSPELVARL